MIVLENLLKGEWNSSVTGLHLYIESDVMFVLDVFNLSPVRLMTCINCLGDPSVRS